MVTEPVGEEIHVDDFTVSLSWPAPRSSVRGAETMEESNRGAHWKQLKSQLGYSGISRYGITMLIQMS